MLMARPVSIKWKGKGVATAAPRRFQRQGLLLPACSRAGSAALGLPGGTRTGDARNAGSWQMRHKVQDRLHSLILPPDPYSSVASLVSLSSLPLSPASPLLALSTGPPCSCLPSEEHLHLLQWAKTASMYCFMASVAPHLQSPAPRAPLGGACVS